MNKRGINSVVGNPTQGDDFIPGGGGARNKYLGHLPNGTSYAIDALRRALDGASHLDNINSIVW